MLDRLTFGTMEDVRKEFDAVFIIIAAVVTAVVIVVIIIIDVDVNKYEFFSFLSN